MKASKIALFAVTGAMLVSGIGLIGINAKNAINAEAGDTTTVYLKTGWDWTTQNGRFALYYNLGQEIIWLNLHQTCTEDIWSADIPSNSSYFIFAMMNPNTSENISANALLYTKSIDFAQNCNGTQINGSQGASTESRFTIFNSPDGEEMAITCATLGENVNYPEQEDYWNYIIDNPTDASSWEKDGDRYSPVGKWLKKFDTMASLRLTYADAHPMYFSIFYDWTNFVLHAWNTSTHPEEIELPMVTPYGNPQYDHKPVVVCDMSHLGFEPNKIYFSATDENGDPVRTNEMGTDVFGTRNVFWVTGETKTPGLWYWGAASTYAFDGDQYRVHDEGIAFGFVGLDPKKDIHGYQLDKITFQISVSYTGNDGVDRNNKINFMQDATGKAKSASWAVVDDKLQGAVVIPMKNTPSCDMFTDFKAQTNFYYDGNPIATVSDKEHSVTSAAEVYATGNYDKLIVSLAKAVLLKAGR
ncbi:MAG: hypothetical protein MJ239_03145 [Bacilli bacterium]|nr:hypothetical protein [Bacilli bacterium]